jgi:hypothetical protein
LNHHTAAKNNTIERQFGKKKEYFYDLEFGLIVTFKGFQQLSGGIIRFACSRNQDHRERCFSFLFINDGALET